MRSSYFVLVAQAVASIVKLSS